MYAYENIEMSLNYIEQHLSEKIETEKLAEIACLSTFYYQRLFKKLVKKSVQEYIKLRRLAMVIAELNNSEERILDIALNMDFQTMLTSQEHLKKFTILLPMNTERMFLC